jgi:hypothetical protein
VAQLYIAKSCPAAAEQRCVCCEAEEDFQTVIQPKITLLKVKRN